MELVPKTGRVAGLQKHLALHQDHQVSLLSAFCKLTNHLNLIEKYNLFLR
jgi:hypothetical protein